MMRREKKINRESSGLHKNILFCYSIFINWNFPWEYVKFYYMNLGQKEQNPTISTKKVLGKKFECLSVNIMQQILGFCEKKICDRNLLFCNMICFLWQFFSYSLTSTCSFFPVTETCVSDINLFLNRTDFCDRNLILWQKLVYVIC